MPELPDVEAVIARIKGVRGRLVREVEVRDEKLPAEALGGVADRRIEDMGRRGKFIVFTLEGPLYLVFHLRMTGDLVYTEREKGACPVTTRLVLELEGGGALLFADRRRLGVVYVVKSPEDVPGFRDLGPEPLSGGFTLEVFREAVKGRRAMIKSLLLDQSFIAGIGNIYGDEVLFQSRIRPGRRASDLSPGEVEALYEKIREVLREAVERGARVRELPGWFVRAREEGRCPKCGSGLEWVRIQGRRSYFCPRCQG